ncbi:MAG TPA: S8 family serine peptidase, partial [Polyangia bacterium]
NVQSPLAAAAAQATRTARQTAVIEALQTHAAGQQAGLLAQVSLLQSQGRVSQVIPFWIFNGVSLQATPAAIQALAARPEVARITPDPDPAAIIVPLGAGLSSSQVNPNTAPALFLTAAPPEPNVALVNAPALWARGFTGQGVVIASLDTGVNAAHPDLAASYRGGSNSWYDPYGQNATPADFSSDQHGTMTMGLMVGGGAGGTSIGMAPGAQWISAKIFDNNNRATITAIHQALQWVLNPNHNPANPGAPDVVNNSWGFLSPGCDNSFQPDVQALLAAGILPIFSAGNSGPNASTSISPANNTGAFSVGSIDNSGAMGSFSSRGPNACNAAAPFPHLVAPGVALNSSGSGALYSACTGTSCSAPQVSGALALLLSALPHLGVDLQQQALINGAVDLGPGGYDPDFGYGRLDVLNSYIWLTNPLVAPTNLAASASSSQVNLSWQDNNQANATGYEVDRLPDGQTSWVRLTTTASGATSFNDSSGLVEGATYSYRVRAVNASLGEASQYASLQATTLLIAPIGLAATAVSPGQINLSWTNNSVVSTGAEIQRSPDGLTGWVTLATSAAAATSFSDSAGLSEGSTYFYRLRAVNPGLGVVSQYVGAATTTWLAALTDFVAITVSGTQINLFWKNNSAHATGIEIQRSPDGLADWTTLNTADPSATSYADTPLTAGLVYYYRARAVGLASTSEYTAVVHAVPANYRLFLPHVWH